MKSVSGNKQSGAVSLFVVIFAMLLITVVTVSFLRLMVGDLRQASNNDLSQSAYDSAMAGTEDAKRALLRYQQYCIQNPGAACDTFASQISSSECNAGVIRALSVDGSAIGDAPAGRSGEVSIQQNTGEGNTFQQAYTCVTIALNTDNVEGQLEHGASKIIPLRGTDPYDRVQISWYSRDDLSSPSAAINRAAASTVPRQLTPQSNWPATRPSVMRAQVVQYGTEFTLSNFDATEGGASNANTVFLYPIDGTMRANEEILADRDIRRSTTGTNPLADIPSSSPLGTVCADNVSSGGYACTMTLILPSPISGNASNRTAYLRLTPFYKATHFEVRLFNSTTPVQFEGVQPLIDSTGRANDLFRRVQSRVEMTDTTFPYPEAAVDVTTEFCKDFTVINTAPLIQAECRYN